MPTEAAQKAGNAPANSPADVSTLLDELAARLAREAGAVADAGTVAGIRGSIRWEARPDRNPPSIVIMRRGSKVKGKSNVLAVISATGKYADLYPSWVPVLEARNAHAVSRMSHKDLPAGSIPAGR